MIDKILAHKSGFILNLFLYVIKNRIAPYAAKSRGMDCPYPNGEKYKADASP